MTGDIALLAVSTLVFLLLARNLLVSRRLRELRAFVADLMAGRHERRLYLKGRDEYSLLMKDLSGLAEGLEEKTREAVECKARLETVLGSIPDAFALLDEKGRIKFLNPAFESLFGINASAARGKAIGESVNMAEITSLLREARNSGAQKTVVFKDPAERHFETTAVRLSGISEGGLAVTFRDITDRRRVEEVKRDFVANVSHELKTPITAIKGYTETLIEGAVEDRENARRFLEKMRFNAERMERLVGDLMTLSKIEIGAMPVNKRAIRLEPVVRDALLPFEGNEKGIALKKEISAECSSVEADPDRLMQILVNLVDNAIKFTEAGSVTVRAHKEETHCVLSVEDTGMGIPKKYLPRLGERFFRVDPSRSRELGGTGLGLAIVKHLVMAHGWKMSVESEAGRGTAVRLYLT